MTDTEDRYATVEELTTADDLDEDDVQLRTGKFVRVRGLTRAEAHVLQGIEGSRATEVRALAMGLIKPAMSVKQVEAWVIGHGAGELSKVADKITELSGMMPGDDKSGVSGTGDEYNSGVRALPSSEARVGNGGQSTSEDVE